MCLEISASLMSSPVFSAVEGCLAQGHDRLVEKENIFAHFLFLRKHSNKQTCVAIVFQLHHNLSVVFFSRGDGFP